MERFRKQSGRRDIDPSELRTHCVSVRLNPRELADLDAARGRHQRGEALRLSSMSRLPAPVPPINSDLRADLGRALGNLSTLAGRMRGGEYVDVAEIKAAVLNLRARLIGCQK